MKTLKAGCILINLEKKEIGLVYNKKKDDYSFPKGHLEEGETLVECALRETEEETSRKCHLVSNEEVYVLKYLTKRGEDVENHLFIAIDDGESEMNVDESLKEELIWIPVEKVEGILSYENLKTLWNDTKQLVNEVLDNYNN